jgi:hypothetical protein
MVGESISEVRALAAPWAIPASAAVTLGVLLGNRVTVLARIVMPAGLLELGDRLRARGHREVSLGAKLGGRATARVAGDSDVKPVLDDRERHTSKTTEHPSGSSRVTVMGASSCTRRKRGAVGRDENGAGPERHQEVAAVELEG